MTNIFFFFFYSLHSLRYPTRSKYYRRCSALINHGYITPSQHTSLQITE